MQDKAKPVHVLMIAGWYPHQDNETLGVFIREHIKAIHRFAKVSVIYVRVEKKTASFPWKTTVTVSSNDGFKVYEVLISTAIRRFGVLNWLIKKAYDRIIAQINAEGAIDICHIHVRTEITSLVPNLEKLRHVPLVISEHWSFYQTGIMKLPEPERELQIKEISHWYKNHKIKAVLPVSTMLGNIMHNRYGVAEKLITKVPNVASQEFRYKSVQPARGKITIVLAAIWAYPKNPMLFLEALKNILPKVSSSVEVNWIGDGPQMNEVRLFIKKNPDLPVINMRGLLPKKDIADIFHISDFLVHPSDSENLPTVIIEALCCGLPVLSNDVGGIPELVSHETGILSPVADKDKFSAALLKMITEYKTFDRPRIADDAGKKYSAEAIGKQIAGIYNKVLNG